MGLVVLGWIEVKWAGVILQESLALQNWKGGRPAGSLSRSAASCICARDGWWITRCSVQHDAFATILLQEQANSTAAC